jgi:molybdopterin/thiamine biosynthesis adenylyltransferase
MKHITLVGAGALGSHVALLLRNVDARLKLVDFDRVEQTNVRSQFHSRKSVGKSKVQSLQQSLQFLFGLTVDGVPHRLVDGNAKEVLAGSDLVIDALDNVASRDLVATVAHALEISCLHGALAPDGMFGRVLWDGQFAPDAEPGVGAVTCEDGEHLPFIGIVASCMAYAARVFISENVKLGFAVHPRGATPI